MSDGVWRRAIKGVSLALVVLSLFWIAVLLAIGGFEIEVFGRRLTTHEPLRPLLIASFALSVLILAGGIRIRMTPLVVGLAAIVALTGLMFGTTAASGADAYGYVSQADLWTAGTLRVSQPWVADLPWPDRDWTFAPLGYRPAAHGSVGDIVPTYSPGLPMLMAAVKKIAGHCAMFLIVPLSGAVLVLATYGIGRRLGAPAAGAVGALMVATSPPVLLLLMSPMTDVPVAAAWAAAFYFLLGTSRASVIAAGISAAVAVLIRPNLVMLAAPMALWYLTRGSGDTRPFRRLADAALFSLALMPGIVLTAIINNALYGSPLRSGYGGLGGMFSRDHVLPNLANYAAWFVEAQTVALAAGFVALVVPSRQIWPRVADRRVFFVIGAVVALLWVQYLAYLVFDVWWYLRFLLASWPFIAVGFGATAIALARRHRGFAIAVTVLIAVVVVRNLSYSWDKSVFHSWQGERRYVSIGKIVRTRTPDNSVILSMQHSGSLRYYGGRVTMRYDSLERNWLDRAIALFEARGAPPFLLLEEWEVPDFKRRFGNQAVVERLSLPPVFTYRGPAEIHLWDLRSTRPPEARTEMIAETYRQLSCVPPAPWRPIVWSAPRSSTH